MVVCDLEELDQPSINYLKNALFLDVSEEEATVNFEKVLRFVPRVRTLDNIAHIINDKLKDKKLAKRDKRAQKVVEEESRTRASTMAVRKSAPSHYGKREGMTRTT